MALAPSFAPMLQVIEKAKRQAIESNIKPYWGITSDIRGI